MKRHTYTYRVVASNGAGIYSDGYVRCRDARLAMAAIARRWPIPGKVFEIERVRHLPGGTHQCSMREGSRWVDWNPHRDHIARKPDWVAVSPERGGER